MISTENINMLPDIKDVIKRTQSLAVLDAIISPAWQYRFYSFNANWDKNEMMASMRDGCGSEYFIWFAEYGAICKGFLKEAPIINWLSNNNEQKNKIFDNVPGEFQSFLSEPAFSIQNTSFCFWRRYSDSNWFANIICPKSDLDFDGSKSLLSILDGKSETYKKWADSYYEVDLPLKSISMIYNHAPLDESLLESLNSEINFKELIEEAKSIGYKSI